MGFYDIAALIIRIGFWGPLYRIRNPPNSIGSYLGPYSSGTGWGMVAMERSKPGIHLMLLDSGTEEEPDEGGKRV